jgi:hypothetical protein
MATLNGGQSDASFVTLVNVYFARKHGGRS